jgi:hypothetical protein
LYLSLLPVISTPLNDREFPIERNLVEGFDSAQLSRFRSWPLPPRQGLFLQDEIIPHPVCPAPMPYRLPAEGRYSLSGLCREGTDTAGQQCRHCPGLSICQDAHPLCRHMPGWNAV